MRAEQPGALLQATVVHVKGSAACFGAFVPCTATDKACLQTLMLR
jgi:hypothetical protein